MKSLYNAVQLNACVQNADARLRLRLRVKSARLINKLGYCVLCYHREEEFFFSLMINVDKFQEQILSEKVSLCTCLLR